jgi:hypothetical protein
VGIASNFPEAMPLSGRDDELIPEVILGQRRINTEPCRWGAYVHLPTAWSVHE